MKYLRGIDMITNCKYELGLQKKLLDSIISYFVELNPAYTVEECYIGLLCYLRDDTDRKRYEIGKTIVDMYKSNIKF